MSSSAVSLHSNGAQVAVAQEPFLDREKIELIKQTVCKDATDLELQMFLNLCSAKRLDPMTKQIYGIKTREGMQMFASIDGLRVIAQRTGEYAGQVGPFWCGADGAWMDVWLAKEKPAAAKVGVLRRGWAEPMWGVATFASYGKDNSRTWKDMTDVMLAKCAESVALRKAFPDDMSGLYIREELGPTNAPAQAQEARPAVTSAQASAPVAAEAVDPATGEIALTKAELGERIKALRELLGWSVDDVRREAKEHDISLNTLQGCAEMVDLLSGYADEAQRRQWREDGEEQAILNADWGEVQQPARDWTE